MKAKPMPNSGKTVPDDVQEKMRAKIHQDKAGDLLAIAIFNIGKSAMLAPREPEPEVYNDAHA